MDHICREGKRKQRVITEDGVYRILIIRVRIRCQLRIDSMFCGRSYFMRRLEVSGYLPYLGKLRKLNLKAIINDSAFKCRWNKPYRAPTSTIRFLVLLGTRTDNRPTCAHTLRASTSAH